MNADLWSAKTTNYESPNGIGAEKFPNTPEEEAEMNLTKNEEATISRLFKRGVDAIGMPEEINAETIGKVVKAGLDAEQKFIQEMLDNRTDRAKKARKVLCAQVYVGALDRGLAGKLLSDLDYEAQRRDFYAARNLIEA